MKYSQRFIKDITWYLSVRHQFTFDGVKDYINKRGESLIQYSPTGVTGIQAFFVYDSQGKILPTKHPRLLQTLLRVKGSVNLHIKMYAEDLVACNWNKLEMRALCIKLKAPDWFRQAIEQQRLTL